MKLDLCLARTGWLAYLLISCAAFADTSCNKQPVAAQKVVAIGRDMIVNGVPSSIVGVDLAGTPDDVSNEFREFWSRESVRTKSQSGPSGLLLSALDDHCLYVLNISPQPDGAHTRGLLSVIRMGNDAMERQVPDSTLPLPEGGKTVSDIESHDPGQAGRMWLVEMPGSARWNAQRYRDLLLTEGWLSVSLQPTYQADGGQMVPNTAFAMRHGADSLDVSFSDRDGKSVAVINVTRNR
jgi:hypothetical protein